MIFSIFVVCLMCAILIMSIMCRIYVMSGIHVIYFDVLLNEMGLIGTLCKICSI